MSLVYWCKKCEETDHYLEIASVDASIIENITISECLTKSQN